MKRSLNFALALGILMVGCATSAPVTSTPASYSLPDLVGVWEGSYTANQGETGLTMTVYEENGNYKAIFYFYYLPGKTNTALMQEGEDGSYYMNVSSNHSTRKYNLVGYEWIDHPGSSWSFVDLEGIVHGDVFTGTVLSDASLGTTFSFRVVRK
ncbi:hypothetical protein ACYULU_12720 [Breznakiellaceae bacterium SP9]